MSIFEASPWSSRMLCVLRVVAGLVFVSAGTMKLFGYPPSPVPLPQMTPMSQLGIGAMLETFGGLAIVLGAFTRLVAFVLSGEMAVAYFQFHFPQSFFPTVNTGFPRSSTASCSCTWRSRAPVRGASTGWSPVRSEALPLPDATATDAAGATGQEVRAAVGHDCRCALPGRRASPVATPCSSISGFVSRPS